MSKPHEPHRITCATATRTLKQAALDARWSDDARRSDGSGCSADTRSAPAAGAKFLRVSPAVTASLTLFAVIAMTGLSACQNTAKKVLTHLSQKTAISQGNLMFREDIARLRLGMSKEEVQFVLGAPMITGSFEEDRWYYLFYLSLNPLPGADAQDREIIFSGDEGAREWEKYWQSEEIIRQYGSTSLKNTDPSPQTDPQNDPEAVDAGASDAEADSAEADSAEVSEAGAGSVEAGDAGANDAKANSAGVDSAEVSEAGAGSVEADDTDQATAGADSDNQNSEDSAKAASDDENERITTIHRDRFVESKKGYLAGRKVVFYGRMSLDFVNSRLKTIGVIETPEISPQAN